jgi:hypothetical protein
VGGSGNLGDAKAGKALLKCEAGATKAAVTKACEKIPVADLIGASGGNVTAVADVCNGVAVPALATLGDYADCLARRERCEAEESITFTSPRVIELFNAVGATFGSAFCVT